MAVSYIPEGYHTVTPYVIVQGVGELIDYMRRAFGAEELGRFATPDGRIMHAAVRIGDSVIELGEPSEEWPARPGTLHLYVEDVDAVYARAVAEGGTSLMEPSDQFYGDRESGVQDAWGNHWYISTHVRDATEEELPA